MSSKQISLSDIGVVKCSMEEAETTINIVRGDSTVRIYTSDNTMITKLRKVIAKSSAGWTCFEGSRDSNGNLTGYFFECPKKCISLRSSNPQHSRP